MRAETGKGASRRARREGKVPAVLYGHGADPQHLGSTRTTSPRVLRHAGTNAVLTLDIEGKEQLALTKAMDVHPIRRNIQHADLLVVRRGEKVTVEVNVVVEGEAHPAPWSPRTTNTIEIEADVQSIPEQLTVSVEGAEKGTQNPRRPDRAAGGVTLISDPEMLVVNVVAAPTEEDPNRGAGEAGERRRRRGPPRALKVRTRPPKRRSPNPSRRPTEMAEPHAGRRPGQPGTGLRDDAAQPRVHGGRDARRSHRREVQGAQEVGC